MVCSGPAPGEGGCGATLEDMGGPRPRARRLVLATAVAAPMLYARWLRPQLLTWGATPEETTGAYPGDKLVPDPDGGATMATTLPAPPERVWPWLVQMGLGRGGWYSWDWLDNDGAPSADRIVAHWQRLEVGQHLDRVPKGLTNWWIVAVLGTRPHPGATGELRVPDRPGLRSAVRSPALGMGGRGLGVPSAAGPGRRLQWRAADRQEQL